MPAITRSMTAEIADAITLFAGLAEKPASPDPDVACKILFLAVLRQQELFRRLFLEKPEFSASMREKCIAVLKCAQRQELRSVCRRMLTVFWPRP